MEEKNNVIEKHGGIIINNDGINLDEELKPTEDEVSSEKTYDSNINDEISLEQSIIEKALQEAKQLENGLEDYRDYFGIVKDIYYSQTKTNKYNQIVFIYEVKDECDYTDVFDSFVFTGKSDKYVMSRLKKIIEKYGLYTNILDTSSFSNLAKSLEFFKGTKVKVVQEPNGDDGYKRYIVTPLQTYNRITDTFTDIEVY